MMGGINNGLFAQGFGGFFAMLFIFIPILVWMSASKKRKVSRKHYRAIRRSLRDLNRK
jgi:phosphotransferase system  glucose/maltose/N-acetylglucosamine-specific IIC component